MRSELDKFEDQYIPEPNSGCYLWLGTITRYGYGQFHPKKGIVLLAHRMSWILYRGPIPKGLSVCHKCDIPSCVNPDHLFLGTQADNMADMGRKGRSSGRHIANNMMIAVGMHLPCPKGERNGQAKLTEHKVLAIRESHLKAKELALIYDISPNTIMRIRARTTWRHL